MIPEAFRARGAAPPGPGMLGRTAALVQSKDTVVQSKDPVVQSKDLVVHSRDPVVQSKDLVVH